MIFFFDNNLPPNLAKALDLLDDENEVIHLQDRFEENAEDVDWLAEVGEEGLIVITRDHRIRKNSSEIKAYRRHNVGAFFLGGRLRRWQIIEQVFRNWNNIRDTAAKTNRPFAFKVRATGTTFENLL